MGPSTSGSADDEVSRLLGLSNAFKTSKALNVSVKLELYSLLARHPVGLTWTAIAFSLGLQFQPSFRGIKDFLDLLVSINTLLRDGDGEDATYRNSPSSSRLLVKSAPEYCGGAMVLNDARSYLSFEHLEEALRSGAAPADTRIPHITGVFEGASSSVTEQFSQGMMGASLGNFRELARAFKFAGFTSVGDVGGGNGCLATVLCQQHPHLTAVTYDLRSRSAACEAYVRKQGMIGRVRVQSLDFLGPQPFPVGHDVMTMSMVLRHQGLKKKLLLMQKAFDALPAGSALIAIDHLIDDKRRQGTAQLATSLGMLLELGQENAFDYTYKEFRSYAAQVGFVGTEIIPLLGTASAAIAYKSGRR